MSTEDVATSDISVMYSLCLFLCLVPALYASMPYISLIRRQFCVVIIMICSRVLSG